MTTEESYYSFRTVPVQHVPGGEIIICCPKEWKESEAECGEAHVELGKDDDRTGRRLWKVTLAFADFVSQWKMLGEHTTRQQGTGKHIFVLGGGLGVEGLAIAKSFPQSKVTISDGDASLIPSVCTAIHKNELRNADMIQLRWGEDQDITKAIDSCGHADVVVGSEVLYNDAQITPLVKTVSKLLENGGIFAMGHVVREPETFMNFRQAAAKAGWTELEVEHNPLQNALEHEKAEAPTTLLALWRVNNGHQHQNYVMPPRLSQEAANAGT